MVLRDVCCPWREVHALPEARISGVLPHIAHGADMKDEDTFRVRPGKIRSRGAQRLRPFVAQALAAAKRAGGHISRQGRISSGGRSHFGRGRAASLIATRGLGRSSRQVVIKARVVRHGSRGALARHLTYLQREGVTRDGAKGVMFGSDQDRVDREDFVGRCEEDRHHFRFIVSPQDAVELADLKGYTRDLMRQMEADLGTRLDWAAVEHWNTDNPHIHVIVRGVAQDGENLVIARDYIREGLRGRASEIATRELGPRSELDIRHDLERQVEAERWTEIDRDLSRRMQREGVIDMAPTPGVVPDGDHVLRLGRLRKLQGLSLAEEVGPGQWTMAQDAESSLRALGERGDVIRRMHRAMKQQGIERAPSRLAVEAEEGRPVIGRLVERGLHDELTGSAYAIVDGIDGKIHNISLPDLEAAADSRPGSIVELRRFQDRQGQQRMMLAVRSDLDIEAQVTSPGATWLDHRNLSGDRGALGDGFGAQVKKALDDRAQHLVEEGLAWRQGRRITFASDLLKTLKARDLEAAAERLSSELGLRHTPSAQGDYVMGTVRQQVNLSSGRFAMIENGLGFQLVPWTPSLDRQMGQHISGLKRSDGGIDWSFGRGRGLGL